ncbi:MAG: GNAT family N-acetyltransferase [Oscillatoriales cyanobacterium CG2_30_44_21]|nr:MAG: GNAT family N-acetyltransferase [Oscillatoriales cyanobacterium CG2_30_44_21]
MLDIPEQFLTLNTPRLTLRKLAIADAEEIFAYARDPQLTTYTLWEPHRSIDDTYDYLNNNVFELYRSGQGMDWGIILKENGKLIGTCGLYAKPIHQRAELGYALSRDYWGQGLMTEAVKAAIAFGFHVMRSQRIQGCCAAENIGSARVLEKSGMQFEGVLRNYIVKKDQPWDVKMYAITALPNKEMT